VGIRDKQTKNGRGKNWKSKKGSWKFSSRSDCIYEVVPSSPFFSLTVLLLPCQLGRKSKQGVLDDRKYQDGSRIYFLTPLSHSLILFVRSIEYGISVSSNQLLHPFHLSATFNSAFNSFPPFPAYPNYSTESHATSRNYGTCIERDCHNNTSKLSVCFSVVCTLKVIVFIKSAKLRIPTLTFPQLTKFPLSVCRQSNVVSRRDQII